MKIILASASPRRRMLLTKILPDFEIIPAVLPEICSETKPRALVKRLAFNKASEVWQNHREAIVLGCDTVVDFRGEILGKPHDAEDARRMLNNLSGKTHFVHTGVCLVNVAFQADNILSEEVLPTRDFADGVGIFEAEFLKEVHNVNLAAILFCETSSVTFRKLSQDEINAYVQSGAPMDKAGAYGIQECGFVDGYEGSYDNIVGLPTESLQILFDKMGVAKRNAL